MSSSTPVYALPFPESADTVDVPRDIAALANRLEAVLTAGQTMPTGTIVASAASVVPSGYLLCDGGSHLRAGVDGVGDAYPTLFAALGGASSPYGLPDGTHFNVPDLRGRVPVGVDGAAARLTANDAPGNTGGEEKHLLTSTEVPKGTPVARTGGAPVPFYNTATGTGATGSIGPALDSVTYPSGLWVDAG